jgi:redox-sensitive bicupin YhaK (pirin superfamily)
MEGLQARIFLNEHLGSRFFADSKDSFSGLEFFSDERLSGGHEMEIPISSGHSVFIIPITGDLILKCRAGNDIDIGVGQLLLIESPAFLNVTVSNPFQDAEINFLLFSLQNSKKLPASKCELVDFNLSKSAGKLIDILPNRSSRISIGIFQGRQESTYSLKGYGFFCFVLAGAFEIQGCLLHAKDGLAIWETAEIEMEALSNNAVLLAIELPYI